MSQALSGALPRILLASLMALIGLLMALGGAQLLWLGGSVYYLVAGCWLLWAAWLLFRRSPWLRVVYALFLIVTVMWGIWETHEIGWGLLPRLSLPAFFGLILVLPALVKLTIRHPRTILGVGGVLLLAVFAVRSASSLGSETPYSAPGSSEASGEEWSHVGHDLSGQKYSELTDITPSNVARLRPVWTYDVVTNRHIGKGGLQATPIQIGDTLYLCSSVNDIIALDAETGRERWVHRAHVDTRGVLSAGCRGVAAYSVPGAHGPCAERIITATVDARLVAVDRQTGKSCRDFGEKGEVSLLTGMGRKEPGYYYVTSAPTIAKGRIVVGGWVTDSQYWGEPSGAIRAFDARTGAFIWAFDAGRPNDHSQPPPGGHYTLSTANAWGPMSADEDLGLVYAPLGNPTPDYVGAQRRPFDEALGTSVIALDLDSGALRWSFQTVHHDLWDYDLAAQPILLDVLVHGVMRKALAQLTKRGDTFLLDRQTGKPLYDVVEHAVPQSGAVAGEPLSPTQPFSTLPSVRGKDLTEASMWGLTAIDQLWCRIRFKQARYEGIFTPPGLGASINYPGYLGGTNWGGGTFDRDRGLLIFNLSHVPTYVRLIPRAVANAMGVGPVAPETKPNMTVFAQKGTSYAVSVTPFLSPLGIPCNQPPFGQLVALDLRTGKMVWDRTLGTTRDSGPFGIPSHLPLSTGMPNTGGPIATASGLTFVAATQDRSLRAFDSNSGVLLWEARLPAGGQATPMTYRSPQSGKQYLVVSAGGNRLLGSKMGRYVVAFGLQ